MFSRCPTVPSMFLGWRLAMMSQKTFLRSVHRQEHGSFTKICQTCPSKNCCSTNTLKHLWLAVWTPLKNISQLGWLFPIYGKIKLMFQTTNQIFINKDERLGLHHGGVGSLISAPYQHRHVPCHRRERFLGSLNPQFVASAAQHPVDTVGKLAGFTGLVVHPTNRKWVSSPQL